MIPAETTVKIPLLSSNHDVGVMPLSRMVIRTAVWMEPRMAVIDVRDSAAGYFFNVSTCNIIVVDKIITAEMR
jgi:hypothetical protein